MWRIAYLLTVLNDTRNNFYLFVTFAKAATDSDLHGFNDSSYNTFCFIDIWLKSSHLLGSIRFHKSFSIVFVMS